MNRRSLSALVVLAGIAAGVPARAAVQIDHLPPVQAYKSFPLEFVAAPNPAGSVTGLALSWKPVAAKVFETVPFVAAADGRLIATLPAERTLTDLDYFLAGTDAKNPKARIAWKSKEKPHRLVLTDAPPHSRVTFTSKPPGAVLSVDGKVLGPGPVELVLFVGDHPVGATLDGHFDFALPLKVKGGGPFPVEVRLKPKPAKVVVDVLPLDAELLIDGFPVGRGHAEGDLTPGPHKLAARRAGYEAIQKDLELAPGSTHTENFLLVKSAASAEEEAPVVVKPLPPVVAPRSPEAIAASAPKPPPPMHWAVPWTWVSLGLAVVAGGVGAWLVQPLSADRPVTVDGVVAHSITYAEAKAYNERIALAPVALGASGAFLAAGLGLVIVQTSSPGGGGGIVVQGVFE